MPDYTSILKRSIETLPEKTPELRQAVYERARTALARQLISVDPPLNPESVELQHQHLEEAIVTVEADISVTAAGAGKTPGATAKAKPSAALVSDRRDGQKTAPPSAMAKVGAGLSGKLWALPMASRAPALIMALLLALIAAGAAVFYYTQGDAIDALLGGRTGKQSVAGMPAADAPAGEDDAVPEMAGGGDIADVRKTEDRLPGGVAAPLEGAQIMQSDTETETLATTRIDGGLSEPAQNSPQTGDAGGTQMTVGKAPATGAAAGSEAVNSIPPGLVGQRAIFEEQGAEGAPGKSAVGVVAWSQMTGENGLPLIVGRIDLPERNAAVSLRISKNTDEALPASHLIEIEFRGAEGLVESPIDRIPALFLKQVARARGERLVGEAVPVTENLYWIALSDQSDQVSRNLALLREGAWFGLPILFRNGRGALISFEKGIPGDQVFEAVLAAWEKADAGQ